MVLFAVLETLWYSSRINGNWSTSNKEVKEKAGYAIIVSVVHGLSCFTYCVVVGEDANIKKEYFCIQNILTYFLGFCVKSNL